MKHYSECGEASAKLIHVEENKNVVHRFSICHTGPDYQWGSFNKSTSNDQNHASEPIRSEQNCTGREKHMLLHRCGDAFEHTQAVATGKARVRATSATIHRTVMTILCASHSCTRHCVARVHGLRAQRARQ